MRKKDGADAPLAERDGLTITYVEPEPRRKPPKSGRKARQPTEPTAAEKVRAAIVAALAGQPQPLSAQALAAACGVAAPNATYKAVRAELIREGTVVKHGTRGLGCTYALPQPQGGAQLTPDCIPRDAATWA